MQYHGGSNYGIMYRLGILAKVSGKKQCAETLLESSDLPEADWFIVKSPSSARAMFKLYERFGNRIHCHGRGDSDTICGIIDTLLGYYGIRSDDFEPKRKLEDHTELIKDALLKDGRPHPATRPHTAYDGVLKAVRRAISVQKASKTGYARISR